MKIQKGDKAEPCGSANLLKRGDFIELEFTGRIKSTGKIFDLTDQELAKKEGLDPKKCEPIKACIGEGHLLKGLDEFLPNKEVGKEYDLEIPPEKAFGKRSPKLIQLTSLSVFKDKNFTPFPGLQLAVDGAVATVRSVTGGRVILDFNHPLAGQTLIYKLKVKRVLTAPEDKIKSLAMTLVAEEPEIKIADGKAELKFKKKLPEPIQKAFSEQVKKHVKEVKDVAFV